MRLGLFEENVIKIASKFVCLKIPGKGEEAARLSRETRTSLFWTGKGTNWGDAWVIRNTYSFSSTSYPNSREPSKRNRQCEIGASPSDQRCMAENNNGSVDRNGVDWVWTSSKIWFRLASTTHCALNFIRTRASWWQTSEACIGEWTSVLAWSSKTQTVKSNSRSRLTIQAHQNRS